MDSSYSVEIYDFNQVSVILSDLCQSNLVLNRDYTIHAVDMKTEPIPGYDLSANLLTASSYVAFTFKEEKDLIWFKLKYL